VYCSVENVQTTVEEVHNYAIGSGLEFTVNAKTLGANAKVNKKA